MIRFRPSRFRGLSSREFSLAALVAGCLAAGAAWANGAEGFTGSEVMGATGLRDLLLHDQAWDQILNLPELTKLLLSVLTAAVLTAAIAFNPVVLAERRTADDFQEPHSLFLYSLIGLLVGVMVMHHGYLIGFVIIGIGALMRFKIDTSDPADTRRLILVTLIGLGVGLNLPVLAVTATVCASATILVLGRNQHLTVEVEFESLKLTRLQIDVLRDLLRERGVDVLSAEKQRFRPGADYLVKVPARLGRETVRREMAALQASKVYGIQDWHVD